MNIQIREAVFARDKEAVNNIVHATHMFSDEEANVAIELVEACLREGKLSGYLFLFAELDGAVVGYACYGKVPGSVSSYDLYWVAVHPNYQGRKIGSLLLTQVEKQASFLGGDKLYIETAGKSLYQKTRSFYEKMGYQKEAVLKDFYAPADDKIIYMKRIGKD